MAFNPEGARMFPCPPFFKDLIETDLLLAIVVDHIVSDRNTILIADREHCNRRPKIDVPGSRDKPGIKIIGEVS